MFKREIDIAVGITTFNNEMLKISVPALAKIKKSFPLIICNDNPETTVSKRQIRALGYHGRLYIINNNENLGTLAARLKIISFIKTLSRHPTWIVFANDDDVLIELDIPKVSDEIFAVIQNRLIIKHRILDLFRLLQDSSLCIPDDENIILDKPNITFVGTLIRADILFGLETILSENMGRIKAIDDGLNYWPPVNEIMWSLLNIYVQHTRPNALPIYMDKTNYVSVKLNTAYMKYGRLSVPARNLQEHYIQTITKYNSLLQTILDVNSKK